MKPHPYCSGFFLAVFLLTAILFTPSVYVQGAAKAVSPTASDSEHEALKMLSEYLIQAASQNPELESAFYRWKAATERIPQEKTLPDPDFTFEYFLRSSAGARPDKYGLMQKFPWFGVLDLKGEIAGQEANAAKAEYDALRLRVFFEVKEAFYEYAYLSNAIQVSSQEIELLRFLESVVSARYSAGATSYDDVIRTQVQLGKQEDTLRSFEDMRKPLMARLASILNLAEGTHLPMPPVVPVMVMSLSDKEILAQFPDSSPEIKKYEHLKALEKAGVDLSKKQYYPEFSLGLEYENAMGDAGLEGMPGSNTTEPLRAVVSINIPFWWERRKAGVREAEAKRFSAELEHRAARQKVTSEIHMALFKYRDAMRKIDLYLNTLVPKAEEALEVTLEAFQTGVRSSMDLIDAQQTLLEFELASIRSLADQALAFARLEMLLGKEIPCEIHGAVLPTRGGVPRP